MLGRNFTLYACVHNKNKHVYCEEQFRHLRNNKRILFLTFLLKSAVQNINYPEDTLSWGKEG